MEEYNFSDIEALCVKLPEEIEKRKWHGDFEGAIRLIGIWLEKDIPDKLRAKLRTEREILKILPGEYPYTKSEALAMLQQKIPDFTEEEFDDLQDHGKIDWIYINGEEHYFLRFLSVLLRVNAGVRRRAGLEDAQKAKRDPEEVKEDQDLRGVIAQMKKDGAVTYYFRMKCGLRITDAAFRPGRVTVHLPVPVKCMQVEHAEVLATSEADDVQTAPFDAPQRTVCLRTELSSNRDFFVEYEFENTARYTDLNPGSGLETAAKKAAEAPALTPENIGPEGRYSDVLPEDLSEQLPHIRFTPYMRSLAEMITAGETDPLLKARKIYLYITDNVEYSYVRTYFTIEDLSEYAAIGRKGDCGIQALMFITLCRIAGVPARWQSGLDMSPSGAGCHDWAQFYCAPFGWLFADPSFGGGAHRGGDDEKRNFYFGNIDPWRMPANGAFQKQFMPPKKYLRVDPYDNQSGEAEYGDRGLNIYEFDSFHTVEEYRRVK
ncbi:MAG: transglutaminase-like domain-containing protein [Lachnospiraceae bacterium]|jgi:transglutaminase-like putative cysteine protease|nr:transglutaminase-like domain-containing protein [Lachnospiraceae bacterium]